VVQLSGFLMVFDASGFGFDIGTSNQTSVHDMFLTCRAGPDVQPA
jgi:hypothetical protein